MIASSAFVDAANCTAELFAKRAAPLELARVGELVDEDHHSAARSSVPTVAAAC